MNSADSNRAAALPYLSKITDCLRNAALAEMAVVALYNISSDFGMPV